MRAASNAGIPLIANRTEPSGLLFCSHAPHPLYQNCTARHSSQTDLVAISADSPTGALPPVKLEVTGWLRVEAARPRIQNKSPRPRRQTSERSQLKRP